MRLLLVEDDAVIAEGLGDLLTENGYVVDRSASVAEAGIKLDIESYDGLIIDRGLPDGDGLEIVKSARSAFPSIPILMLTARNQAADVVAGLDRGADDYLSKPFLPEILLARLRALLRRTDRPADAPDISVGDISVNTNTRSVSSGGSAIRLSPKEYQLLVYLLLHRGMAIDRQSLLDHVWGDETDMFSNTVDVHVRYLRKKLDRPGRPSVIVTVRGKGYMICAE